MLFSKSELGIIRKGCGLTYRLIWRVKIDKVTLFYTFSNLKNGLVFKLNFLQGTGNSPKIRFITNSRIGVFPKWDIEPTASVDTIEAIKACPIEKNNVSLVIHNFFKSPSFTLSLTTPLSLSFFHLL